MEAALKRKKSHSGSYDSMVTARVPKGIKEQGDAILREIGASPTKLVNSAYDFVIAHRRLPSGNQDASQLKPGVRKLSAAQKKQLRSRAGKLVVGRIQSEDSFRDLLNEAKNERYPGSSSDNQPNRRSVQK